MLSLSSRRKVCFLISTLMAQTAFAGFDSGSTGVDGDLTPANDVVIQLPESGVLNYRTINIPVGVTVKFSPNSSNTSATLLASGNVTIAGTIDLNGANGQTTGAGVPIYPAPLPGPGGFPGGVGGKPGTNNRGSAGVGPSRGGGGMDSASDCAGSSYAQGGGGAGNNGTGAASYCVGSQGGGTTKTGYAGPAYGAPNYLPLVGGSGGGGGGGSSNPGGLAGTNGGAGGGALMLVASGTVTLSGKISAHGGAGGNSNNGSCESGVQPYAGAGGGGSGGGVRILASAYSVQGGVIDVSGGKGGCKTGNQSTPTVSAYNGNYWESGGDGAPGFVSIEILTNGVFNQANIPTLRITKIGGVDVPNTGGAPAISLPADLPNPATVEVAATNIPVGTTVLISVVPPDNDRYYASTPGLAGTTTYSTASGSINVPAGTSSFFASTSFTLTLAQGEALSTYAQGEQVQAVELIAGLSGKALARLTTVSGKHYDVSPDVLAILGKTRS